MIRLEEISKENWVECARLSLAPEQEGFVAPAVYSIAESKFLPIHRLRAIYTGDVLVGMLCFCHEDDPVDDFELYWLFRLLIDKDHQGKGYGTAAIRELLEEVKALGGKRLRTMHKPVNEIARKVYVGLGFREIGVLDDGDILYELEL